MSYTFAKFDVLTIERHDKACMSTVSSARSAHPAFICPQVKNIADNDPKSTEKKGTPGTWMSKISKRAKEHEQVLAIARKNAMHDLEKEFKIKPGLYVYSRLKDISPLSNKAKNKPKTRTCTYGTIISRSEYQPRFWLTIFQNGKSY